MQAEEESIEKRERAPIQRLKSSELVAPTSPTLSPRIADTTSSSSAPAAHRAPPSERGPKASRPLENIGRSNIGSVVEMQAIKNVWQAVRIVDVQKEQVQVVPQKIHQAVGGKQHVAPSWTMRWVEFQKGLFRSTSRPLEHTPGSGDAHVSRAAQQAAELLDKRPVREAKKPDAFSPRNYKKTAPCEAAAAARPAGGKSRRRTGGEEQEAEAEGGGKRAAKRARMGGSRSSQSGRSRKKGKHGAGGGGVGGEGEEAGRPNGGSHRRDWGLMHMGDVGRNKPPFARTLLFKGCLQEGVRLSGEPCAVHTQWVVKRWPEKSARRKVDLEVHERIRQNPCHNIVEIVGVDPQDGVLMEYCPEGDLQALLAKSRRTYMPLRQVAVRLLDLMKGLAHLHRLNIVHADVSPANVFLRPCEDRSPRCGEDSDEEEEAGEAGGGDVIECVLGDFGHSYILDQHTESRSSVANHCGSEFVAPEVESGSVSTMASDIYSAGMILSQLVTMCSQFKENFSKESTSLVRALSNLAKVMSHPRPESRPVANACVKMLKQSMTGWGPAS